MRAGVLLCRVAQSTTGETALALTSFSGTLFRVLEYSILGTCCYRNDFPCLGDEAEKSSDPQRSEVFHQDLPRVASKLTRSAWAWVYVGEHGPCGGLRVPTPSIASEKALPAIASSPPTLAAALGDRPERRRRRYRRPTVCVWWRRCNRFLTLVGPGPSSRSAIGASACSAGGDGRCDFVGGERQSAQGGEVLRAVVGSARCCREATERARPAGFARLGRGVRGRSPRGRRWVGCCAATATPGPRSAGRPETGPSGGRDRSSTRTHSVAL
jgi:hypothetical protein